MRFFARTSAVVLVTALFSSAVLVPAQNPAAVPVAPIAPATGTLAERVAAILSDPAVKGTEFGISVRTLEDKPVYSHEEEKRMIPASNTKLATTAAAYALLPVDSMRWTTNIVSSGKVDAGGVLRGDLVLLGVGDPTIDSYAYPYRAPASPPDAAAPVSTKLAAVAELERLADQIAAAGIRSIDGNVIGDDSFFLHDPYGISWAWDDLATSDGAPATALTFNDNAVDLFLHADEATPGATVAEWTPKLDYYTLDNTATLAAAGAKPQPAVDRAPGAMLVRSWGTIAPDGLHVPLAIEDPAQFMAAALVEALRSRGIRVKGTADARHRYSNSTAEFSEERALPLKLTRSRQTAIAAPLEGRSVLASRTSPTLADDITVINKVSQNLHVELLLRLLGKVHGADGSIVEGARVVRQFLTDAGIDDNDFFFYDGSGMSANNRIAPRALAQLLVYAQRQSWGAAWRASLPVAGVDGSLRRRFADSPLKEKLWAKTGTLDEVNALSGYLTAASGKTMVFSIIENGRRPGSKAEVDAIDRIAEAIAATN